MDQLSGLRQILRNHETAFPAAFPGIPVVWGVCSGKGGTGKSLLAAGIALTLSRLGKKVLLLDGDFHLPGLRVYLNHLQMHNVPIQAADILEIGNFISEISANFHVFFPKLDEPVSEETRERLLNKIQQQLPQRYDILIADLPGGFAGMHRWFAANSALMTVVVGQDYGSFSNSYALIKLIKQVQPEIRTGLWVNLTPSEEKAGLLHRKLNMAVEHFLGQSVTLHGWTPTIPDIQREMAETRSMVFWPAEMHLFRLIEAHLKRFLTSVVWPKGEMHAEVA